MLEALHDVCKPDAKVLFLIRNPSFYEHFGLIANNDVNTNPFQPWEGLHLVDPRYVKSVAEEKGFICRRMGRESEDIKLHEQVIKYLKVLANDKKKAEEMLFSEFLFELSPK
jgi:hypothetical protein